MAPRWLPSWALMLTVLVSLSAGLGALSESFPEANPGFPGAPPAMNAAPQAPADQTPRTPPPAMDESGSSSAPS
jgi:hypothetical protein